MEPDERKLFEAQQEVKTPEALPAESLTPVSTEEKHFSKMNYLELMDYLNKAIPSKYSGLSVDALKVVWSPDDVPFLASDLNNEKRNTEIKKRELILIIMEDFLPEQKQKEYLRRIAHKDKRDVGKVKAGLGLVSVNETPKTFDKEISSGSLDQNGTNHIESLEGGVVAVHDNTEHGQDGFAINGDAICLSDGASSYGKAGLMSKELSVEFSKQASEGKSIKDIFDEKNVESIVRQVSETSEFKDFDASQNPHARGENAEAALATVLLTKLNRADKSIEWGSIGDSPLLVLDKDENGNWTFEVVNDDIDGEKVNNTNFTREDIQEVIKNPETYLLGVNGKGEARVKDLKQLRTGKIEYKSGRVVIAASDFLTKMMVLSPETINARITRAKNAQKIPLATALQGIHDKMLGTNNPLLQDKFKPELFFDGTLSPEELKSAMMSWKEMESNNAGRDDMTAVCIKMDEVFKQ